MRVGASLFVKSLFDVLLSHIAVFFLLNFISLTYAKLDPTVIHDHAITQISSLVPNMRYIIIPAFGFRSHLVKRHEMLWTRTGDRIAYVQKDVKSVACNEATRMKGLFATDRYQPH